MHAHTRSMASTTFSLPASDGVREGQLCPLCNNFFSFGLEEAIPIVMGCHYGAIICFECVEIFLARQLHTEHRLHCPICPEPNDAYVQLNPTGDYALLMRWDCVRRLTEVQVIRETPPVPVDDFSAFVKGYGSTQTPATAADKPAEASPSSAPATVPSRSVAHQPATGGQQSSAAIVDVEDAPEQPTLHHSGRKRTRSGRKCTLTEKGKTWEKAMAMRRHRQR
ncbi:Zinc finger RING-type protein [Macrophomina phaseolina MS6]|uniref:Zinc finger RING-type protein n=1 Tax=Macrophomina phaseolina (strain MS6) TaxID=1126212 RepID=K2QVV2_MACPH|nr:Zinc finger RING-type protein [Macrophomina phaseolina MS6]